MAENVRLKRTPGMSLNRAVYVVIQDEIQDGVYEGGALPSEEALCDRFGVSRITIRRALTDLETAGLIERRHGIGSFVTPGSVLRSFRPSLSLVDSLRDSVQHSEVKVLSLSVEKPGAEVASMLNLPADALALKANRLRSVSGRPLLLTEAWVPPDLARGMTEERLSQAALYECLQDNGVRFGRVVQEFTARAADPYRAKHLAVALGTPLQRLVRVMHDAEDRPILFVTLYLVPDAGSILMEIPGDTINSLSAGQVVQRR